MNSRNWIYAWLMLLPAFVFLIAFTHLPAVTTLFDSFFTTAKGRRPAVFTGLGNYQKMLEDPIFVKAMVNSAIYAAITIPASIALSLAMALMVHRAFPRREPDADGVLHTDRAAADRGRQYLAVLLRTRLWADRPDPAVLRPAIGQLCRPARHGALCGRRCDGLEGGGVFMIFFLAALQTIPQSLREAAAIEGCSRWTFFRRVTLPLIMPTTLFVSVNAVINAFRLVDHVFVMTKGGPDSATMLLLYYIFETGFRFWDTAYAAALTVVLIAILSVVGIGQFFLADRRVHYK
jgi:sn-glycerol 3-phosphate transport system permease protein